MVTAFRTPRRRAQGGRGLGRYAVACRGALGWTLLRRAMRADVARALERDPHAFGEETLIY
jgi:hypothetical protein